MQPTDLDVVNELEEGEDEDLRLGLAAPERRVDVVQLKRAAFLGLKMKCVSMHFHDDLTSCCFTLELVTMSERAEVANGRSLASSKSSARMVTCCSLMRSSFLPV